jgi:hypothetical protein
LEILEEERSLPAILLARKSFIQTEFLKFMEEEESYWHRRTNPLGSLRGTTPQNIPGVANGKKRGNVIFVL